ncbi:glycosyltransferase family 4 protein [Akkermansiaceae bacterium]|nr:glycosyltransferase family 4 protein [Akkermansiaceae bacterium]
MRVINKQKLLYFVTEDWVFCTHRLPLAVAAREAGYDVAVVTNVSVHADQIQQAGIRLIPYDLKRGSVNPFQAIALIRKLASIYKQEKPDLVHHVAIKPILYGAIAARLAGVKQVVNAITGMGYIFTSDQLKARVLRPFINLAFKYLLNGKHSKLIMQNDDDRMTLIRSNIVDEEKTVLIRGAGVDTSEYSYSAGPTNQPPLIVLPARLLKDKGVVEFVGAAKLLKERGVSARFALVGDSDYQNHAAVSEPELKAWVESGILEWWGRKKDMPEVLESCHIVCLPSYREGLPKALLEGASCGRPIVTTDTVGCREVVVDGENGFLVPLYSTKELAGALQELIKDPDLRLQMGKRGREMVLEEFTIEKVVFETLAVYRGLIPCAEITGS